MLNMMRTSSVKTKAVFAAAALLITMTCFGAGCTHEAAIKPVLGDFPNLFLNDTLIVVGSNASQIETEEANCIVTYFERVSGTEPAIKTDINCSENDKSTHNLILIGLPSSNQLLNEVYARTNVTRITDSYPDKDKGLVEITANPWRNGKALLIISGNDSYGIMAGSIQLIENASIRGLNTTKTLTDGNITLSGGIGEIGNEPFTQLVYFTRYGVYRIQGDNTTIDKLLVTNTTHLQGIICNCFARPPVFNCICVSEQDTVESK